jgi:predicted Zn-dependent protease
LLNFGYYDLGGGAYANPNWYVEEAYRKQPLRRDVGYGPQIDVEEVERLFTDDPLQEEPHWKVMVTGVDLNARAGDDYINFVYGATDVRFPSSVQSVRRFMEEIPEGVLRDAVIRRLLRHEVGHMFGLPLREENTVEMLGPHCTNPCTMRQGMSMPEWANLTVEEHNNGIHFCEDCTADLDATRSLYRPLPQGRDAEERAEKPTDTTRTAKESRDESASAEVYFIGSGGEQQEVFPRSETERDDSTDDRER